MKQTRRPPFTTLAAALLSMLAPACSGGHASPAHDGGASGEEAGSVLPMLSYAPTMTAIYNEILVTKCAQPFCHLGIAGSPPIFTDKETSYHALVNTPASGMKCADAGLDLVVPGQPDMSLMYRKLEVPSPADLCGDPMPGGGPMRLPDPQIQQVEQWIMQGAMDN